MTIVSQNERKLTNRLLKYMSLPVLRGLQGLLLALGAPLGWIIFQWAFDRNPFDEQYLDWLLYIYMTLATGFVFSGLGYYIGRRERIITGMALTDGLTGLYNKRYFENRLFQEFAHYKRTGKPISLVQIDLDHFKKVNDTWGHQAGDEVLKSIATLITNNCRATEVAARVGGEELSIIAVDCDLTRAHKLAERLRSEIESNTVAWQDKSIKVTSSFGVASVDNDMPGALDLFQCADKALYHAKKLGRNRVCSYDKSEMG